MLRNMPKGLVALVFVAVALALGSPGGYGDSSVPYTDASATGSITLCDNAGRTIDHGNVSDVPFAWAALSSTPAQAPFDQNGRTATLFAFQPRENNPPQDWSGGQLTAGSSYTDPAHPVAVAAADEGAALKSFLESYPTQWNGLVQLRMFLGAPGQGINNNSYPATDIQVTGSTWKVLRGGGLSCDLAVASLRQAGVPASLPPTPAVTGSATSSTSPGSHSTGMPGGGTHPSGGSSNATAPGTAGGGAGNSGGGSAAGKASGGDLGMTGGLVGVAILVLVGAGLLIARYRRRRSANDVALAGAGEPEENEASP